MRWKDRRQSENVEDLRGSRTIGAPMALGGGLGFLVLIVIVALLGGDPRALLQMQQQLPQAGPGGFGPEEGAGQAGPIETDPAEEEAKQFVSVVLADTEDVWREIFTQSGKRYQEPKLVLFRDQVRSACGMASAAVGPFYCPGDSKVYLDLGFFEEMRRRFRAAGDFAQAYVIAHEIGHHVQNQLGITDQVHAQQGRISQEEYNELSVRLELQADFLAGAWAHHAQSMQGILERGDIEEALNAAQAIGDDRLQMEAQGYVVPESFTHGTSEQRARWFRLGLETGDLSKMDTFSAEEL